MEATIFDGTTSKPCSVQEAQAAVNQPGISWIDIRLQPGDADSASDMLTAVGVDPAAAQAVLGQGLGTDFTVHANEITGVCWLDDNDGTPTTQCSFTWNSMRLVTLRCSGDAAVDQVRHRITDRLTQLSGDPSTLPGVVLQLMLATVQQGLTQMLIDVGTLDMEIIATPTPQPTQAQRLTAMRESLQGIALRFPMYSVNVQTALIDLPPVTGLDAAGTAQLQQFLTSVQATSGLIGSVASAVKSAAQDIQAQVSTWQGNRINMLTVVTMIFLPITFLTGYFGMNFSWLDDQLNSYGSWLVLGLLFPIALVIGAMILLGRRGYAVPHLFRRHVKPGNSVSGNSGETPT